MEISQKALNLTVRPARWTFETECLIARALTDATIDDIKRQTDNGAQLFAVVDDDAETVAAFVLRIDRQVNKSVGVIVAAASARDDLDLTAAMLPVVETMFAGVDAVRMHVGRPGLAKKVARLGYGIKEIVLQKELKEGGGNGAE